MRVASRYRCRSNRSKWSRPSRSRTSKNCRSGLSGGLSGSPNGAPPSTTAASGSAALTARYITSSWVTYSAAVAVHEPAVVLRVLGRRRRQELGRLPGRPPRAGADGDPDLLGPVQLVEEGVHGVEVVPAGLGLDLGPVEVDPDQPCPERAELG